VKGTQDTQLDVLVSCGLILLARYVEGKPTASCYNLRNRNDTR